MLLGAFLLGATSAANNQSRYAAADLARPQHRGRDLSLVVWATTVGAVLGPNLSGPSGNLAEALGLPRLTGPFLLALIVMLVACVVVAVRLRPDPLLVARELARAADPAPGVEAVSRSGSKGTSWSRVLEVMREYPAVAGAVSANSAAHAVMVAVMVMTPLHMHHGGAELEIIGLVISIHVVGMFAFAPLVGMTVDRVGAAPVLAVGAIILLASLLLAGISPSGGSWQIGAGLFLLGLGWSLATVAGSTLLTDATPLYARTDVKEPLTW